MSTFHCCGNSSWISPVDLGHAQTFDFALGRCDACGKYWMQLSSGFSRETVYLPVSVVEAERLFSLAPGPGRKSVLSDWFDAVS